MNIYFSANARDMESSIDKYRLIIKAVRESGNTVIHDWTEVAVFRGHMVLDKIRWQELFREAQMGIDNAALVIAEVSGRNVFGVGYEVSSALNKGKPVLALVEKNQIDTSYINGIVHPLLTVKSYSVRDLAKNVKAFIEANEA